MMDAKEPRDMDRRGVMTEPDSGSPHARLHAANENAQE